MLDPANRTPADLPANAPPRLVVVVDTEEEFDWSRPLARENTAVETIRHQIRAHRVYEAYGVRPVYVIDYPVASQPGGFGPLRELRDDGLCEIGAHLHPWVNPPHDETVTVANSYPGNLPPALEREKLVRLTAAIEDNFSFRPRVYKAGRYGVGRATTATLAALGYDIDTSVVPGTDMGADGGPDFRRCGAAPYWFGPGRDLLEVPLTVGFRGALAGRGPFIHARIAGRAGMALRLPGIFGRLGLLERMKLTPEGVDHDEHRRLTRLLLARGQRVFCLAFHSPSLEPGHTPYVRSGRDLDAFLDRLARYFDFFVNEIGGRPATLGEIRALAEAARPTARPGESPRESPRAPNR